MLNAALTPEAFTGRTGSSTDVASGWVLILVGVLTAHAGLLYGLLREWDEWGEG